MRLRAAALDRLPSASAGRAAGWALAPDAAGAALPERSLPRSITSPTCPEEAGAWALPQGEFGLDVIALVGRLRYREQRSVPQIHQALRERGVEIAERSVTVLLHRYEELVALRLGDPTRLRERLAEQGGVILALDGLQPDVGHEVLWVLRDVLSGEVLLARSLLGATEDDLVPLLDEVRTPSRAAARGRDPHSRGHLGRAAFHPQRRGARAARRAAPALPVPLPARGGPAALRGGPPRQEGAQEATVRGVRPIERALEGRATRGGSRPRLLPGHPQRAHRRRAPAAGGLRPQTQGTA